MKSEQAPLRFIVLLGIVSLFADITYEGARGIIGPYLSILGASGTDIGFVIGLGALLGYGMRSLAGYLSDKTQRYWIFIFVGYALNLAAIPLLALTDHWQTAAVLIILERFGKAIRVPSRDALLSYATKQTGRGWGFGLHEALDQIGAVLGPLFISLILFYQGSYRLGFSFLAIPAVIALCVLIVACISTPHPQEMEQQALLLPAKGLPQKYWIYVLAVGLVAAGYADFALIAYHFQKASIVTPLWISLFYSISMAVDGLAALIMGRLFDTKGISILAAVTALTSFFAPLVFLGGFTSALFGMILWGIGMGSQESLMRAVVANLAHPKKRAMAYGMLNLVFGVFWAIGSAAIGIFYDVSLLYVVAFSMITQLASVPLFLFIKK